MITSPKPAFRWSIAAVLILALAALLMLTDARAHENDHRIVNIGQSEVEQAVHRHFGEKDSDYQIIKSEKLKDDLYEVHLLKQIEGKEAPIIPYDVALVDGEWRFITDNILVYPKALLETYYKQLEKDGGEKSAEMIARFNASIVAENEHFVITKNEHLGRLAMPLE